MACRPPASGADEGGARLPAGSVLAVTPSGESLVLEQARSFQERARGLMFRPEVPRGTGMLFRFETVDFHPFWMLNCLVSLDLVWLDAGGVVIDVAAEVPPCPVEPCPSYRPRAPAAQVIEVGAGEAARLGISPGAKVLIVGGDERNRTEP